MTMFSKVTSPSLYNTISEVYNNAHKEVEVYNLKCPYCGGKAHLRDYSFIYPNTKYIGKVYVCENFPKCDSYVGCHPNTTKPLGRLANKSLRHLKAKAHEYFDPLWRNKCFNNSKSLSKNRSLAYKWLATELNLTESQCHIGKFDTDTCRKIIKLCKSKQKEFGLYNETPMFSKGYKRY